MGAYEEVAEKRMEKVLRAMLSHAKLPPETIGIVAERAAETGLRYCLVTAPYLFPTDKPHEAVRKLVGLGDTLVCPISLN